MRRSTVTAPGPWQCAQVPLNSSCPAATSAGFWAPADAAGASGLEAAGRGLPRLTDGASARCQHHLWHRLALPQLYRGLTRQAILDLQRLYLASNTVDHLIDLLAQSRLPLAKPIAACHCRPGPMTDTM